MVKGVAHTLRKERGLQPTTAQLWNRSRTAEQSNSVMDKERTSCAGLAVKLGEEAQTLLACCSNGAGL